MKYFSLLLCLCTCFISPSAFCGAADFQVESPDGKLRMDVEISEQISLRVSREGKTVLQAAKLGLQTGDGLVLGENARLVQETRLSKDEIVRPVVALKSSAVRDHYNALTLKFKANYSLQFRVYDKGIAYRFITHLPNEILIKNERLELNFPSGTRSLFPEEESMLSHNERLYVDDKLANISGGRFASLPVYTAVNENIHVVFTEADLYAYPAMYLSATGGNSLKAKFPGYVTRAVPREGSEDRNEVLESADYIAVSEGERTYPWRLALITDNAGDLVESDLVFLLSRENQIKDPEWIKPGKIAWDWYNANNIYGVDFRAGINTETYKYYIDFAADYNLDYVILDEGWTKTTTEIKSSTADIDVPELVRYGEKKGVGIILWSLWKPLDKDYANILKLYASWGVKGVKIDFMQRSDQYMVEYYEKIAREAAKNKLLLDFHGAFKPAGLRRAFPNVLSYEGVKGNENNKWSQDITPEHNLTLPFTRMVAGPMDYTPGAMKNTLPGNHRVSHFRPMSMGTRAHQIAMYVVFESPLQMLCDSPTNYYREHESTDFISKIPTVWDETKVLSAVVGDSILIARRRGETWYIAAMTDATARELDVDFSFLKRGRYKMDYIEDGINADRHAQDYQRKSTRIKHTDKMRIKLAPGGGWAAIVRKR